MLVEFVYSPSWFAAQSFCISSFPTKEAGRAIIQYFYSHLLLLWWLHSSLHKLSPDGWGFVVVFFPFSSSLMAIVMCMCIFTGGCIISKPHYCVHYSTIFCQNVLELLDQKLRENSPDHLWVQNFSMSISRLNSPKHLHSNLLTHRKIVSMTFSICSVVRYIRKITGAWICLEHSLCSLSAKRSINHYYPVSLLILQPPQKAYSHKLLKIFMSMRNKINTLL